MQQEGRMLRRIAIAAALVLLCAGQASANTDISFVQGITQDAFRSFSREVGSAISYKNVAPAAPLGITGFDIAAEVTFVDIRKDAAYWQAATGSNAPSVYAIPKVRLRKGLPFGIDVGAMYSKVPDSNIQLYGAEIAKALLEGSPVSPALGVRATYTRLAGVGDLDLQTVGLDASLSKGFFIFTPYVGGGAVWIDGKAKGRLQTLSTTLLGAPLKEEKFWQERVFGGIKISPLPFFNVTAEVEYSEVTTYSLRAAIGF
jgi:hypothetical protein